LESTAACDMSINRLWAFCLAGVAVAALAGQARAQLSSPVAPSSNVAAPAKAQTVAPAPANTIVPGKPTAGSTNSLGVPQGQGAGVHSPNSPFAPLPQRTDVIPWSVLTAITTKNEKNKILPVFGAAQISLHQKNQKVQGFMMPLEPGPNQRHFLLTSVPLTCSFCLPGGPESMIEVRTKTPVKYSLEPVVVEGRFLVLNDDPYGLYYRITEAVAVK
jgi:uncharacterized protein